MRRQTHLLAVIALLACGDAAAPSAPNAPNAPNAMTEHLARPVPTTLLDAVSDADARVVPTLDIDMQPSMHAALTSLRAALADGDAVQSRKAIAAVRALLRAHDGDATDVDGDGADLAAVALLLDAADAETRPTSPFAPEGR